MQKPHVPNSGFGIEAPAYPTPIITDRPAAH